MKMKIKIQKNTRKRGKGQVPNRTQTDIQNLNLFLRVHLFGLLFLVDVFMELIRDVLLRTCVSELCHIVGAGDFHFLYLSLSFAFSVTSVYWQIGTYTTFFFPWS